MCISDEEVQSHMTYNHNQVEWEERILRLESELRLEKGQHQDHLKMLETTLKESSGFRQQIEGLDKEKGHLEAEIVLLKEESYSNYLKAENTALKIYISIS